MSGRIVVGVDGSAAAAVALGWAATEARLRGAELVVCSVVERHHGRDGPVDGAASLGLEESAGGYPTTVLTRYGKPEVELIAAAEGADLLIVGSRGRGRLAGSLLGSVSRACLAHARCPVVVVGHPPAAVPVGRVIAGVDGSVHARSTLLAAAEEARVRGATLHVLHAVHWDSIGAEMITPTSEQLLEWGHKLVTDELAATGVLGEPTVVVGHPGPALVHRSGDADLIVLGARGHHAAAGLLLGSTGEHCIQKAHCPVMVTRADRHDVAEDAEAGSPETSG